MKLSDRIIKARIAHYKRLPGDTVSSELDALVDLQAARKLLKRIAKGEYECPSGWSSRECQAMELAEKELASLREWQR